MKSKKGFLFTDNKPKEIIEMLGKKGFKKVVVAGGSILNNSFMKDGLIDELFLDVEPMVFGQGIPLFSPSDFEFKLELLGVKNLSKETIQLHYEVVK